MQIFSEKAAAQSLSGNRQTKTVGIFCKGGGGNKYLAINKEKETADCLVYLDLKRQGALSCGDNKTTAIAVVLLKSVERTGKAWYNSKRISPPRL